MSKLPKSTTVDNLIQTIKDDKHKPTHIDNKTNSIQVVYSKCIDCGSCAKICGGYFQYKHKQPFGSFILKKSGCMSCGKCAEICPAKAITYTDNIHLYKDAFVDYK